MVMLLHGCSQQHNDIQAISGFDDLADKHQFIMVYPFVTKYFGIRGKNCWGWWLREHIRPGRGESEDLINIAKEVIARFPIDSSRIHIAGLSSGGGMAVAALVNSAGIFASGAVVAGVSYGERVTAVTLPQIRTPHYRGVDRTVALMREARREKGLLSPLCIVHSHDDETVRIQSARNLRDSWLAYLGVTSASARTSYSNDSGYGVAHTRYGKWYKPSAVETIFLEGCGHGWSGGNPGEFSFPDAPNISQRIWRFFSKHSLLHAQVSSQS